MKIPDYVKNDEMLSDYLDELHRKQKIEENKMNNILNDYELERMFDEHLDDVEGQVQIMGYYHYVSNAIKKIDPVAYKQEYHNWIDSQVKDGYLRELAPDKYALTNEGG